MNNRLKYLQQKTLRLTVSPGVYIMKDENGGIIYIGKAKNLKNRVSSYFRSNPDHTPKVAKMVENVFDYDFIVTDSEYEALLLECSLIKQHKPKYNILLKDDKGYHYINISDGNLYIAERIFEDETDEYGYSLKVGKQYIFKKYDLKSCKLLKSKNANYVNGIRYVTVCKDTFYFFCDETQTVNNVCLDKDVNYPTIQHPDVKFITSNSDCVYYISEKTESAIILKTVESPYNGIWKLEVGSNKPVKIADKCDCDELLATKNFLYCYTINYILPRGVANSWVKGYLIDQLAIS